MGVELWEQTTWDKTWMLLGTYWELGNMMGTREKTKESLSPCPLKKEKRNWTIHECILSENFLFKVVCHHFFA
jgi:hypothetical protein